MASIDAIDARLSEWLLAQPMFFVATAPLAADGLVNCSPKGLQGSFSVVDPHQVAYLDLTGSGIETVAHVRENGRIVIMFCAFEGKPKIVRLHGVARVVEPQNAEFDSLVTRFPTRPGIRAIITVDVARISQSCGFGVPLLDYVEDRDLLDTSSRNKGPERLAEYRAKKNALSIDGLPGLAAVERRAP